MISRDRVEELLSYDSDTGLFVWLVKKGRSPAGRIAGCTRKDGHITIRIDGRLYMSHQLAWLVYHGEWPSQFVDHINGIPNDNRIANLRLATQAQNIMNCKAHKDNLAGMKGVSWCKSRKKWRSSIGFNNRIIFLGRFDKIEDAANAYKAAAEKYFGEFARFA